MIEMPVKTTKNGMTEKIYGFLRKIDKDIMRFKSPQISRLYLWKPNIWNAALVEGTGWIIYSIILFFIHNNLWLSISLPVPLSFFTKYLIYNRWLFRENSLKKIKENQKREREKID